VIGRDRIWYGNVPANSTYLLGGNVGPSQQACENADCVLEAVHTFNDLNLDYEPAIQLSGINSNGFVHMVAQTCGIPLSRRPPRSFGW